MSEPFQRRLMGPDYKPGAYRRSSNLEDRRVESDLLNAQPKHSTLELLALLLQSFASVDYERLSETHADKFGLAPAFKKPVWWDYTPEEAEEQEGYTREYQDRIEAEAARRRYWEDK